jgi:hypothetical protein
MSTSRFVKEKLEEAISQYEATNRLFPNPSRKDMIHDLRALMKSSKSGAQIIAAVQELVNLWEISKDYFGPSGSKGSEFLNIIKRRFLNDPDIAAIVVDGAISLDQDAKIALLQAMVAKIRHAESLNQYIEFVDVFYEQYLKNDKFKDSLDCISEFFTVDWSIVPQPGSDKVRIHPGRTDSVVDQLRNIRSVMGSEFDYTIEDFKFALRWGVLSEKPDDYPVWVEFSDHLRNALKDFSYGRPVFTLFRSLGINSEMIKDNKPCDLTELEIRKRQQFKGERKIWTNENLERLYQLTLVEVLDGAKLEDDFLKNMNAAEVAKGMWDSLRAAIWYVCEFDIKKTDRLLKPPPKADDRFDGIKNRFQLFVMKAIVQKLENSALQDPADSIKSVRRLE